jgi:hypothetical protein
MIKTALTPSEIEKAEKLLAAYFSKHHNQSQLRRDTQEGEQEQELFTQVLIHNSCPKDKDFLNFLHDKIWAIHESLRFGLLDDIVRENTVDQIRTAFRNMLLNAPSIADADSVLAVGKRPYLGVSILSEALCKVYPDHFSIKNKRSEWALYFILSNAAPNYIENELSYSNFIAISWQVWSLIEHEYHHHKFSYDMHRRLWYVDRFYLWIYDRPETKEIMKALGHVE